MHKLELHAHSAPVSRCASASPLKVLNAYRAAGYQGIVLSNHINLGTFDGIEDMPWDEKAERFLSDYHKLKAAAGEETDILLACEINLSAPEEAYIPNDYLVYGITEDWIRHTGDMRRFTLAELSARVREADFLLVQAHPFRYNTRVAQDRLLDGVEVYNANKNHDSHDPLADLWADMKHLIKTSGSDFHDPGDLAAGGIESKERILDNAALLRVLRSGEYTLIRPDSASRHG